MMVGVIYSVKHLFAKAFVQVLLQQHKSACANTDDFTCQISLSYYCKSFFLPVQTCVSIIKVCCSSYSERAVSANLLGEASPEVEMFIKD